METTETAPEEKKKHWLTWERAIEIAKLLATVWVALIGTICTMQYNERQHELNSIEAIAKILPHLSAPAEKNTVSGDIKDEDAVHHSSEGSSRDGAIWAAFRIANNKVMLRDLAALYPEDIYRVVSSIAAADGLANDPDALRALEVSSEKLGNRYLNDPKNQALSARLLDQAARIRQHMQGDNTALNIVDITAANLDSSNSPETTATLLGALNKLAQLHLDSAATKKSVTTEHSRARTLFLRARQIGLAAPKMTGPIADEIAVADRGIATILKLDGRAGDAESYEVEAKQMQERKAAMNDTKQEIALLEKNFKELDKDGDGSISVEELKAGHDKGLIGDADFNVLKQSFDELANAHQDAPSKVSGGDGNSAPVYKDAKQAITLEDLKAAR